MAATLIVGLGGMGQKIVRKISDMIDKENVQDVELVVMDTDVNDLRDTKMKYPRIHTVQTSPHGTVGAALDQNTFAKERWFPLNDGLMGKPFTEGAGQVRAVSRLAFDHAIEQGYMSNLEKAIENLHSLSGEIMHQEMRVMLIGSNNGGTGSGLVLPAAMFIRNFLITRYQDNAAIIRAFLLEPDTIFDRLTDEEERNNLRCNAYACIREVDAFFRKEYSGESDEFKHVVFNAPKPGSGERVNYPNILPYHFVFLMDRTNSAGENLPNHEAYLQHAAETVFAQTLSAVSTRSNSSEDNVIRSLAASNGRSRYCGAGSSYLEYPVEDVRRYIGYSWAIENLSEEWLELDSEFRRLQRDDEDLKIEDYYTNAFRSLMDSRPFYKKIGKSVFIEYDTEGGAKRREWPADEFPEAVMNKASTAAATEISTSCRDLLYVHEQLKQKQLPTRSVLEGDEDNRPDANEAVSALQEYYELACRYNSTVEAEVSETARRFADTAYTVSDFVANPLENNLAAWQVESLLRKEEGGIVGAKHPCAARFLLYSAKKSLLETIEDCETSISQAKRAIQGFMNQQERQEENALQESEGDKQSKKKKFRLALPSDLFGGSSFDEETISELGSKADALLRFKKNIDKRFDNTVALAYLNAALTYIEQLINAYEGFYGYLSGKIEELQANANSIEENPLYRNDVTGQTHRYVCASPECLKSIKQMCPVEGDSAALPAELCGRIYDRLLHVAKLRLENSPNAHRSTALKGVFDETIIEYWFGRVLEPGRHSVQVVDMSIAEAIAAEARFLSDNVFAKKEDENAYIGHYVRTIFDETFHLAAPFIEPPVGEMPRTFKACAYSSEILDNIGGYSSALREKLEEYNGISFDNGEYSKHSIMFYRSMYGFCASNLPKYAPAQNGLQPVPEGEYHHAYYRLVNNLSPNLRENNLITPHIDKNWHLVDFLPELNPDFENSLREDTVKAYIFGLIYQQFKARQVSTGEDVYYLTSTANQRQTNLWVSNGTPCDKFYEVFDAMKFNPRAVAMLLARFEEELRKEKDDSSYTIHSCRLLKNVRSEAFERDWSESDAKEMTKSIIDKIHCLKDGGSMHDAKLDERFSDTTLVTDFFGLGDQEFGDIEWDFGLEDQATVEKEKPELARRSILEIPIYYRISLPQSETRVGEVDTMVESIFSVVRSHLSNFTNSDNLDDECGRFFEEQYMLFEHNLTKLELSYPGISSNAVVNSVREKTLSFFEPIDSRFERVKKVQNSLETAWRKIR